MTHEKADHLYTSTLEPLQNSRVNEEEIIKNAVLRLNGKILGFVIGSIAALAIFVATNWLVLKGGDVVGPHMGLLGQFFWGYSVTFGGSLVGAAYAFLAGYLSGIFISWVYNGVLLLRSKSKQNRT